MVYHQITAKILWLDRKTLSKSSAFTPIDSLAFKSQPVFDNPLVVLGRQAPQRLQS